MNYEGKYSIFDVRKIKTYPVAGRNNKVKHSDLIFPDQVNDLQLTIADKVGDRIKALAKHIVSAREKDRPVIFFTGGHLIKNGLSLLLGELIKKNMFSMISGNGSTSIHDFELALIGETSEYVPQALEKGEFGMAYEFNYINAALSVGDSQSLGYGEAVGKMVCDSVFREEVEAFLGLDKRAIAFTYPELCVQAVCYERDVPFTVHAGIGTDVLDQHPYFDGRAKGGCSGRDFLMYANEIAKFERGGVILNVGSAVTGPEVFLKAASMAGNIGRTPDKIITANFDLRSYNPEDFTKEDRVGYYYRDQKSIVTRVPDAYNGQGFYIGGNQIHTFPLLYKELMKLI
ncbi:hypothetical protein K8352_15785 [Flavobacteriaceae bacterium F89]|uniref:Deoxyhypusine synthase n=1 Tax=Cerina litoralis TaxID=2874477 RepID=A0AAE3EYQ8_9FLAO|nr:hypothetical protein [Cerina litoralis]MCG2462221.1 hypothetical protein [Cerina litoralis]